VRLDSSLQTNQGPIFSTQLALLNFGASTCFLDEEFTRLYKIPVVKKLTPVYIEVINERPLSSGDVTQETTPLEMRIGKHSSSIIFNIIKILSASVILGLS
jgi:hypothetical protein